jgi:hypothetical protein
VRIKNKNAEIILLGDKTNRDIKGVTHHFIDDYFESAKDFEENYYIHMSKNPYQFELTCYQRWFIIAEFIKERYESFWYFDSDVIVYGDLTDYLNNIPDHEKYDLIGFDAQNSQGDSFNPAFNFYTAKTITKITEYLLKSYVDAEILKQLKAKWRIHLIEDKPGGVCDMTQLQLFFADTSFNIFNSYDINNDVILDGNINARHNYSNGTKFKMLVGTNKYTQVKDYDAFVSLDDGTTRKLIASHFQGEAKKLIRYYSRRHFNPETIIPYLVISKMYNSCLSIAKSTVKRLLK